MDLCDRSGLSLDALDLGAYGLDVLVVYVVRAVAQSEEARKNGGAGDGALVSIVLWRKWKEISQVSLRFSCISVWNDCLRRKGRHSLDLESGLASVGESTVNTALVVGLAFFNDDKVGERNDFRLPFNHVRSILECDTEVEGVSGIREELEIVELVGDWKDGVVASQYNQM